MNEDLKNELLSLFDMTNVHWSAKFGRPNINFLTFLLANFSDEYLKEEYPAVSQAIDSGNYIKE